MIRSERTLRSTALSRTTRTTALASLLAAAFPIAALADLTGTVTLQSGSTLSLDTGATATSGGDLLFTGNAVTSTLAPQGSATVFNATNTTVAGFNATPETEVQASLAAFTKNPLPGGGLPVDQMFFVHTNGGNFAKVLVTAVATGSITLMYDTFGISGGSGGGGAATPTVTEVQNNYSYISPGPAQLRDRARQPLHRQGNQPREQYHAFIAVQPGTRPAHFAQRGQQCISVTVNGTTTVPGIYYTSTGQLAAVLSSSTTPVGTGTITVTSNGVTSATAQMLVVQSALGLDVATDASYNFFSTTNSASPGAAIILWGSGVGADTANNDLTYPLQQDNLTSIPMTVYIGGISATIAYRGRSQFPGVDQVVVTIPNGVPVGCSVSIVAVSGSIVSNSITIPVAQGGSACSDPTSALTPAQLQTLSGKSTISFGALGILTSVSGATTSNNASATFSRYPTSAILSAESNANIPSLGSCVILTTAAVGVQPTGLDAGTVTLTGTAGTVPLPPLVGDPGLYDATLPAAAVPPSGGTYTFTGTGGKDVGAFSTTLNFPPPLVWTNSNITTVNRAQGQTVNWTGGAANSFVQIEGQSSLGSGASLVSATFICYAPIGPGQFTVPSWVLLALPPNPYGSMAVTNQTAPQTFTASGLDYSSGVTTSLTDVGVAYQ